MRSANNYTLDFPPHTNERTSEGTKQVQALSEKFAGDNLKLMRYWQQFNCWLSNDDGRRFGISSYLSARVKDLRHKGIQIEDKWDEGIKRFRLKCTCKIVGGNDVIDGCYAHDKKMKL